MIIAEKIKELYISLKNGIIQMISANVLNKIVAMLSNMAITRILSRSEFGVWSYILNIYSYLSLISGLGLATGALQFGTESYGQEEQYQYYKYSIKMGMIIDTIIVAIIIIGCGFYEFSISGISGYLRIYVPIILIEYLLTMLMNFLRSNNEIKLYARSLNINTVLVAVGTCVGAFGGIIGVIVGKYLAFLISIIVIFFFCNTRTVTIFNAKKLSTDKIKGLWHFSIFTGISAMLNSILYLLDVTMIGTLLGDTEKIAIYKVGTLIPNALIFIPSSVVVSVLPSIIINRNNIEWLRAKVKKLYISLGMVNGIIAIGGITFARLVILIIAGPQYADSVVVFRILLLGYAISGTFRSLSINILSGLKRIYFNLFISILSGVSDIVFNIFLIRGFGIIGAAMATFITEVITAALSLIYVIDLIYLKNNKLGGKQDG